MDYEDATSLAALPAGAFNAPVAWPADAAPEALPTLFRDPDEIDKLIKWVEDEARAHVPDTTTRKGRDAIKALAFKVTRSKTALDEAGKQLNAGLRRQIDTVDVERRKDAS